MDIFSQNYFISDCSKLLLFMFAYLIQALIFYKLAEKAKLENRWMAFIPILQFIIFFHIIDRSALYVFVGLITIIPIIGPLVFTVIVIYWKYKFYKAFGMDTVLIVLAIIIPFASYIIELYMAFSDNVEYIGSNSYQV